ncbi:hypothetical protein EDD16DRAFT_1526078 [Pisolithus croceorrhizus]|nr:hypothetical protein EDD16DRAFT_1526078 [Pisolithus croceorrhizus]KAI6111779.1 hypothetical protein EV401DRAFT_1890655 [Pisolithus croceorrhizus]KAI6161888.1 hypothetical protein EDD17DRAFT_1758442 [Pisolithus thermaeus]
MEYLSQILCNASFHWLEASKVKRSETLVKKLIPLFESYKAHNKLLGRDAAQKTREDLIKILSVLEMKGGRGKWLWYDMLVEKPFKEGKDQLGKTWRPLPLNEDESEGNLNAHTQQPFQFHQHNHNKIKQIIQIALPDELGLGFGGKALPEVLQEYSEMEILCLKAPAEPFKAESEQDLGGLYPVDLPDAMTEKETAMYSDKQEESGLASLSSFTTFKNNANSLWVMDKNEGQAGKGRATALQNEY